MTKRHSREFVSVVVVAAILAACADRATPTGVLPGAPMVAASVNEIDAAILNQMDQLNASLAAQGAAYRAGVAEYIAGGGNAVGARLVARDVGNKQLDEDFVPFDPRREGWSGPVNGANDDITFAIDQTGDANPPGPATAPQATAAIRRAMATWDAVKCSKLVLTENPSTADLGVVAFILGFGGSPFIDGDYQHAGWGDVDFEPGVIAATFTFVFVDGPLSTPTDIDGNGKADVAFRETYYDPSFAWNDGADIDVESIALHEAGHGLSQDHFGNLFVKKGQLTASPRAVMNAVYFEPQTSLLGTDKGGHCSNWANWPNK